MRLPAATAWLVDHKEPVEVWWGALQRAMLEQHRLLCTLLFCSGGVELLFGNQKTVEADIPQNGGQVCAVAVRAADKAADKASVFCFVSHRAGTQACRFLLLCSLQLTVAEAMAWARDNLLTERPELFMKGSSV